jgi:hypothetical protein
MTISARIVADSMNTSGVRITTMELVYPRFIHAELMTHRVFSRNASSSRAIPVKKMLSDVWHNPAEPIHWGANQPGMQANGELEGLKLKLAKFLWRAAGKMACVPVKLMSMIGLHKQVANRILEPWQHIHVVVTSTEWDNFYALRCHSNAQPEMLELAGAMQRVQNLSSPRILISGEWHLPYVSHEDKKEMEIEDAIKVSAARCARVSYLNQRIQRLDPLPAERGPRRPARAARRNRCPARRRHRAASGAGEAATLEGQRAGQSLVRPILQVSGPISQR